MDKYTLTKLQKLQKIRVRTQEKLLLLDKKTYVDACDKLEQRNATISQIHNEKDTMNIYQKQSHVVESQINRERVHIRRFWLDYDLEMHEYYHDQESNAKSETKSTYIKRKTMWNKEKQKMKLLDKQLSNLSVQESTVCENQEDEISQENSFMYGKIL